MTTNNKNEILDSDKNELLDSVPDFCKSDIQLEQIIHNDMSSPVKNEFGIPLEYKGKPVEFEIPLGSQCDQWR